LAIEATRIAEEEFKNRVVANMIMLGAMATYTGWISLRSLENALEGHVPPQSLEISRKALRRGAEVVQLPPPAEST
jgi:Pyruvate/2-oxoacid:ferredoxin oxidoreductase gamma subunit